MKNIFIIILIFTTNLFSQNENKINHLFKEIECIERVLILAIQPGFESVNTINYYRNIVGAEVKIAYLTNGESSIDYSTDEIPIYIATKLRKEAYLISLKYGNEYEFLNIPDEQTSEYFKDESESILQKINEVIKNYLPTTLIIEPDLYYDSSRINTIVEIIVDENINYKCRIIFAQKENGKLFNYLKYGNDSYYKDFGEIRKLKDKTYKYVDNKGDYNEINKKNEWLLKRINSLKKETKNKENYLIEIHNLIGDMNLLFKKEISLGEQKYYKKVLLLLEELRSEILKIKIRVELKDKYLCPAQITNLIFKNISGEVKDGETILYFPGAKTGWIINESIDVTHKLTFPSDFKIITPQELEITNAYDFNQLQEKFVNNLNFIVVHNAKKKEYSFSKRISIPFQSVPRFTINAQEPIIIASKTKEVKIKFTNYTHDRLRDKVYFKNEYLESDTQFVSLVTKDSEHELKFKLNWKKEIFDTIIALPIIIGFEKVANIYAKGVDFKNESTKSISINSNKTNSVLKNILSNYYFINSNNNSKIIFVDEKYISNKYYDKYLELSEKGKHIIFINTEIENNIKYDTRNSYIFDETAKTLNNPFEISIKNGNDWVYHLNNKYIEDENGGDWEKYYLTENKISPIIVTKKNSMGRITFVNMNLTSQLFNLQTDVVKIISKIINLN
ncbi:MAG: hypothetical protein AAB255_05885 [Bacteroidota bacterium]